MIPREGVESTDREPPVEAPGQRGHVIPREGVESARRLAKQLGYELVIPREGVERILLTRA